MAGGSFVSLELLLMHEAVEHSESHNISEYKARNANKHNSNFQETVSTLQAQTFSCCAKVWGGWAKSGTEYPKKTTYSP